MDFTQPTPQPGEIPPGQPLPQPPVVTPSIDPKLAEELEPTIAKFRDQLGALWGIKTISPDVVMACFDGGILWLVRNIQDPAGQPLAGAVWTTAEAPEAVKFLPNPA